MKIFFRVLMAALVAVFVATLPKTAQAQAPTFDKVFSPDAIRPGDNTTLTFTITNIGVRSATTMAFTDTLPVGTTIATPAAASHDCDAGTLTAPDGGGTITFSGGTLDAGSSCTLSVQVTASTAGTYTNTTGDLTSSLGNSGSASDTLTVSATLPSFSKSFAPSSITLGATSTVTFTIDNTAAGAVNVPNLDFTDSLPVGIEVASPANASTTCGTATIPPTLTAIPGSDTITLDANGTSGFPAVANGATCTVAVDVTGTATGTHDNAVELLADFVSAGTATASLVVTGSPAELLITKTFTDEPVGPGGTVTLEFAIANTDRNFAATGVAFTDNLAAMLASTTYDSLLFNDCGGSVSGVGTSNIGFSGGTIAPEGVCTIRVSLGIPSNPGGTFTNTTSAVTGTIDGSPVVGNMATDNLTVFAAQPLGFTKRFHDNNPVSAGSSTKLEFTISNPNAGLSASDIEFIDDLTAFLPFPVSVTLPGAACGGSISLISLGTGRQGLELTGGSLAPMGSPGDSCTFEVTIDIPLGIPGGTVFNSAGTLSATLTDGGSFSETVTTPGASASLTINAGVNLSFVKEFTDDPVAAGGTATLEFTISSAPESTATATGVTFTDALAGTTPALPGAVALGLPLTNLCGIGEGTLSGTSTITLSGAELSPGETCTFSVPVAIPGLAASGDYINTTSALSATVGGDTYTYAMASDTLQVVGSTDAPLTFTKEFLDDPAIPGETVTLRFTLQNTNTTSPSGDATITFFTDNLAANLAGLAATGPASLDTCGGTLSGTTFLIYVGGSVSAGDTCTIEVPVLVPTGAADGAYANVTSSLSHTVGGAGKTSSPAVDTLIVEGNLLQITKDFTDDPVVAGDTATLEFTLTNLSSAETVSAIAFTDDLSAMLSGALYDSELMNSCGGAAGGVGTGTLSFSGGSLTAGSSCTVRIAVSTPGTATVGNYTNTTSDVSGTASGLAVSGDAASAVLSVVSVAPPSFSKAFAAPSVFPTQSVDLTFTITNNSSTASISNLQFTDDLGAFIPGATATTLPGANPCGSGSSISGSGFLTFTGGNLGPSETCNITVTVTVPDGVAAAIYPNTTSNLTSAGLTIANPASANLTVNAPEADVSVTKTDGVTSATAGGSVTYTIVAANAGPSADPAVSLTDTLPAGLTCNYTSTAAGGATGNTASGAGDLAETLAMPAGSSVSYTVGCTIDPAATGTLSNTATVAASVVDADTGNNSATDGDTVISGEADVSVTKTDGVTGVAAGGSVTYTIVAANAGPSVDPAVTLSDTLPADLTCNYTSAAAGGATGNTASGAGDLVETLAMPAGSSVTYTLACTVDPTATGTLSNTATVAASVTDPVPGNDSATDGDTVISGEADLSVALSDSPDPVDAGGSLTYTVDVSNAGPSDADSVISTFTLPAGVTLASTSGCAEDPGGVPTCSLGTIAAGDSASYTVSVNVDGSAGPTIDATADVSSAATDADLSNNSITETTTVTPVPLGLSMSFAPSAIEQFQVSMLTYTFTNTAAVEATGITLTDTLPGNVMIATPANASTTCTGGTLSAPDAGSTVSYTGGSLAAGGSCTVSVDVTGSVVGNNPNTTEVQSSSLGASAAASASLRINPATTGTLTIVQDTDTDGAFVFTSAEPSLNFTITTVGGTGQRGPITLPIGSYAIEQTAPDGVGNTAITCTDGDSTGEARAGTLTVNLAALEAVTCTFTSVSSRQRTVDTINRFLTKRADLILSSEPSRSRRIDRLKRGFGNASALSFANGDLPALLPVSTQFALGSNSYGMSGSLLQFRQTQASLALAHGDPRDALHVANYRWDAWFDLQYKEFDADAQGSGHFAIGYFGADYLVNPDLLIGALIQFDDMEDDSTILNTSASGSGWMAGPYVTARIAPNLYFDARIAAGESDNRVSPFNTYVDKFTTDRWMAMAALTGDFQSGNWSIQPNTSLSFFEESQNSYIDGVGVFIPSQTVSLGQFKLGPTFTGRFQTVNGTNYAPFFGFDAIYNFGDTSGVTISNPATPATDGWRGRLTAGLDLNTGDGVQIGFSGSYDGIGRSNFDVWGLTFELSIPISRTKAR